MYLLKFSGCKNRVIHISISTCDRLCLPAFDWTSSWGTFPKMIENRTWFWAIHERLSRLVILLLSNFLNHHLLLYANSICTSSAPDSMISFFNPLVFVLLQEKIIRKKKKKNIATNNPRPFNQTPPESWRLFCRGWRKVDIPSHPWKLTAGSTKKWWGPLQVLRGNFLWNFQ